MTMEDTEFYTATMAKVYADQGHTQKALEIYRYILEQDPERSDVAEAISKIEEALFQASVSTDERLLGLFQEWISLMMTHARLTLLKKIKNS
jgi:hypothetical protein